MSCRFRFFLLFLLLTWWLSAFQKPNPDGEVCSAVARVESQEVYPFSLQYRKQVCQLLESSLSIPTLFSGPDHRSPLPGPNTSIGQVAALPSLRADPCYGLMSMQL